MAVGYVDGADHGRKNRNGKWLKCSIRHVFFDVPNNPGTIAYPTLLGPWLDPFFHVKGELICS